MVPDALILGIDTTGPADSVALVQGPHTLATLSLRHPPTSSRPLLRLIDMIFTQAACHLSDVTAIAVNVGPGAFTGLRVGLATAHGLSLAYQKPLVGCSAFDALVGLVAHVQGAICTIIEARKGEVYAAFFHRQGELVNETSPGVALTPLALCRRIEERTVFVGSGVTVCREALVAELGDRAICFASVETEMGLAVSIARLGGDRWQRDDPESLTVLQPLYIRPADARLPGIAADAAGVTL